MIIGITGNTGSGKSTLAQAVSQRGYAVIDADKAAHEMYAEDLTLREALSDAFGAEAVVDNEVQRAYLRSQVFGNPDKLNRLNGIVHPALKKYLKAKVELQMDQSANNVVFLDAALIFEWDWEPWFDKVVLISAPSKLRGERLQKRGVPFEDAQSMVRAQMPESLKKLRTNWIIENSTTVEDMENKMWQLFKQWGLEK